MCAPSSRSVVEYQIVKAGYGNRTRARILEASFYRRRKKGVYGISIIETDDGLQTEKVIGFIVAIITTDSGSIFTYIVTRTRRAVLPEFERRYGDGAREGGHPDA